MQRQIQDAKTNTTHFESEMERGMATLFGPDVHTNMQPIITLIFLVQHVRKALPPVE